MVSLTAVKEHHPSGVQCSMFRLFWGTFHSLLKHQPVCSLLWFVNIWLNLFYWLGYITFVATHQYLQFTSFTANWASFHMKTIFCFSLRTSFQFHTISLNALSRIEKSANILSLFLLFWYVHNCTYYVQTHTSTFGSFIFSTVNTNT